MSAIHAPVAGSRLLRLPAVQQMSGLSKSEIYRRQQSGQFPKGRKLSSRVTVWVEREIMEWQRTSLGLEDLIG